MKRPSSSDPSNCLVDINLVSILVQCSVLPDCRAHADRARVSAECRPSLPRMRMPTLPASGRQNPETTFRCARPQMPPITGTQKVLCLRTPGASPRIQGPHGAWAGASCRSPANGPGPGRGGGLRPGQGPGGGALRLTEYFRFEVEIQVNTSDDLRLTEAS